MLSLAQACTATPAPADTSDGSSPDAQPIDVAPRDVVQSDIVQSDITPNDVTQSDVTQSDVTESDVTESDVAANDVAQNDADAADTASDVALTDVTGDGAASDADAGSTTDVVADAAVERECLDNVDNDGNGLVDCADPACTPQVRCESTDWSAPGTLNQGALGSSSPCGAGQTQAYFGTIGSAGASASCACSCRNAVGSAMCAVAGRANEYNAASCPAGVPPGGTELPVGCHNSTFASAGYLFRSALAERGTCTATTTPTIAAASGPTSEARVCVTSRQGGGCGAGSVCRARVAPAPRSCVVRRGDHTCPAEYAQRSVFYENRSDTRACNSCTCAYRSDGCTGDVVAFSGTNCTGTVLATTVLSDGSCRPGNPASYRVSNLRSSNPRCTAGGTSPTGCVRDSDPSTICCASAPGDRTCPTGPGPAMALLNGSTGPFCIDTTEVTNAQYQAFLASMPSLAGQPARCTWNTTFVPTTLPAAAPNQPVVGVDWCDAAAYCRWAGKTLCGRVESPAPLAEAEATSTSSQWFQACTQRNTAPVPYGAALDAQLCSTPAGTLEDVNARVCCSTANPRLHGLLTNAAEWIDACSGSAGASDTCRVMGNVRPSVECATNTQSLARNTANNNIGFRCCAP